MAEYATKLARELLATDDDGLEAIRIHELIDDASAHDDKLHERLYAEFGDAFDLALVEISQRYGRPWRAGRENDGLIPLNGVFRFALWEVNQKLLFLAASHEERETPVLLVVGTVYADNA